MKTVCGKTISYLQTEGESNKAHSTEGPAIVYAEGDGMEPEYYLYGIKYSKANWKERVSQYKIADPYETLFNNEQYAIYD